MGMPKSGNPWKKFSTKYYIIPILEQVQEQEDLIMFHGKKDKKRNNKKKNYKII